MQLSLGRLHLGHDLIKFGLSHDAALYQVYGPSMIGFRPIVSRLGGAHRRFGLFKPAPQLGIIEAHQDIAFAYRLTGGDFHVDHACQKLGRDGGLVYWLDRSHSRFCTRPMNQADFRGRCVRRPGRCGWGGLPYIDLGLEYTRQH